MKEVADTVFGFRVSDFFGYLGIWVFGYFLAMWVFLTLREVKA